MLRVYPAFISEETCRRAVSALKAAAVPVGEAHSAGAAVIRAVAYSGGGLVLCGPRLSDMTAQSLAQVLWPTARVLVLSAEADIVGGEKEGLLHLSLPLSFSLLAEKVSIVLRQEEDRLRAIRRRRSPGEERLIHLAKEILSARLQIDEQEAHKLLQRLSMQKGQRMEELALKIIDSHE